MAQALVAAACVPEAAAELSLWRCRYPLTEAYLDKCLKKDYYNVRCCHVIAKHPYPNLHCV